MPEASIGLTASVQLVTLNKGLYSFTVQDASPNRFDQDGDIVLPAIQVAIAPGIDPQMVEFMTGLRTDGAWLFDTSDMLIAKVKSNGTSVLVSSYSARNLTPLAVNVERIDQRRGGATPSLKSAPQPQLQGSPPIPGLGAPPRAPALAAEAPPAMITSGEPKVTDDGRRVVRVQIAAHISSRGDMSFVDEAWAGVMGEKLPIEASAIRPLEILSLDDVEYKGLTEKGVETPWTSGGDLCGTQRMNLWLSGFAIRLKGEKARQYECTYRGSFRSGAIVGPMSNGAPLHAASLDDVLQAISLTIVERPTEATTTRPRLPDASAAVEMAAPARPTGPRFSVFREEIG